MNKTEEKNQGTAAPQKPRGECSLRRQEGRTLLICAKMASKMSTRKCPLSQVLVGRERGYKESKVGGCGRSEPPVQGQSWQGEPISTDTDT